MSNLLRKNISSKPNGGDPAIFNEMAAWFNCTEQQAIPENELLAQAEQAGEEINSNIANSDNKPRQVTISAPYTPQFGQAKLDLLAPDALLNAASGLANSSRLLEQPDYNAVHGLSILDTQPGVNWF